uniref:Putative secreted protein n=1 Tax=Panstrongylus lignarius TaxID=156445 RepID=A0A224Y148_9HEMI
MMKENILPVAVLLLAFAYLIICSPTVSKREIDVASEDKNISKVEENEQSLGNETLPLTCELYLVENGSFILTNRTKEELTQEELQYHEECGVVDRMSINTLTSLVSG